MRVFKKGQLAGGKNLGRNASARGGDCCEDVTDCKPPDAKANMRARGVINQARGGFRNTRGNVGNFRGGNLKDILKK